MSIDSVSQKLSEEVKDDALVRQFLAVWPEIESILQAFSKATNLPIFIFFGEAHIFQSSLDTMPPFCHRMLSSPDTASLCITDGHLRASRVIPELKEGIQMCHAGMLNGRRDIETGIGTLTILFGSRKSTDDEAINRRQRVIKITAARNISLAEDLQEAADSDISTGEFEDSDIVLMDAITDIVQQLINATAVFRFLSINMAHELSLMMINLGLLTKRAGKLVTANRVSSNPHETRNNILDIQSKIEIQCRLGLYIVRNFLSHTSENRYNEVVNLRFRDVNLVALLSETVSLYRLSAAEKNIDFEYEVSELPFIRGIDMEIRRLFSNVISNAIKYSYHSVPNTRRIIRIKSKNPYDPGFKQHRFSITFENYGLGLTEEERRRVFQPGFRGKQAVAEVPIGSGIGLSEANKIVKLHKGEIKLQSKELYHDDKGPTYLTTVDLIFPYPPERTR